MSVLEKSDRFVDIRKFCKGQLKPNVYREIFAVALAAPPGDFIEIGTAHGAATVALALALKEGGQQGRVHTFGKPGVGAQFASADELRERFQRFGVEDVVTVHIAEAAAAPKLLQEPTIALLMLDADGRIDRDFCNLFDRIERGAPIIIDDYEDRVSIKIARHRLMLGIGMKWKLTFCLANYFRDCGYIEDFRIVNQTLFCRKSVLPPTGEFDKQAIWDLYGSIIFSWQAIDWQFLLRIAFSVRDMMRPRR